MIFIHSSFRTASTYLWSLLRQSLDTVAFYEIFHEQLARLTVASAAASAPEGWHSKHPPGAPYALEFLPLLRKGGGVEGFRPEMSYRGFVPAEGPSGDVTAAEVAYVQALVAHAEAAGRVPVLTATRSLGRLVGLKRAVPGLHILLYRNLFHQWCSSSEQAYEGNPYFLARIVEIARLGKHDPTIRELLRLFPARKPSPRDPAVFFLFVFLHLHLYVHAAGAADLVVDVERLTEDPGHRAEVEARFAAEGTPIDLSGARKSIAFSLCPFGPAAEVTERLKVIGDLVIGRAPTEVGRRFGEKVIADLIGAFHAHEFHTATMRRALEKALFERDEARTALAARPVAADLAIDGGSAAFRPALPSLQPARKRSKSARRTHV